MKYSISREQQFFFEQNHYIEFDGLLSLDEQKKLHQVLKTVGTTLRDLSNVSEPIKTIAYMSRLAKLASELTHKRFLRFGFDQLLSPPIAIGNLQNEVCIQGLVCVLYLSLDTDEGPFEGHGIFALPTVDLATLPLNPEKRYFLIGWADERAQYIFQPKDPHTHELKKHGYVFGDRLNDRWHPTLMR